MRSELRSVAIRGYVLEDSIPFAMTMGEFENEGHVGSEWLGRRCVHISALPFCPNALYSPFLPLLLSLFLRSRTHQRRRKTVPHHIPGTPVSDPVIKDESDLLQP